MDEISQLCQILNCKERELRRLNRLIKYLEDYQKDRHEHEAGFFKIDTTAYLAIRTKLMDEIKWIIEKLQ